MPARSSRIFGYAKFPDEAEEVFGTDDDWLWYYDEATSNSLVLKQGTEDTLAFSGSFGITFAAADDTNGNDLRLFTADGGTIDSGTSGKNGGDIDFYLGDGSSAKAASASNGGEGGSMTIELGQGGTGDGIGLGGSGKDWKVVAGRGGNSGGAIGTAGDGGNIEIKAGQAGEANGGTDGSAGKIKFREGFNDLVEIDAENTIMEMKTVMVCSKQGTDVASANDATLTATGNYFDVTGAVQINTLSVPTGAIAGTMIVLQFDGAPTVKDATPGAGASFALAGGGADFVATAGDTLMVVYDGGVWREISRTVI